MLASLKTSAFVFAGLLTIALTVHASPPPTFEVVRNQDGTIKLMNQQDSLVACAERSMHLATVEELAAFATLRGAKGIWDVSQPTANRAGYYFIRYKNGNSLTPTNFHYSHEGYQRPEGDLGDNWYWSSSDHATSQWGVYVFSGKFGYLNVSLKAPHWKSGAALCAH